MASEVEEFLTAAQEQQVIEAIRIAERKTSGEIRVHIEAHCTSNAVERAQELFHLLKMDNTKEENGILFYVAVEDHQFAVIGDRGIHAHVGDDFWNGIRDLMVARFRESDFTTGLRDAIEQVGKELATYFPWDVDDENELPNEISTS